MKIEKVEKESQLYNCTALILRFILSAKEFDRSVTSIMKQMVSVFNNRGAVWVIKYGESNVGYFMAQIVDSEYDKEVCLVHELFIEKQFSKPGLVHSIDSILGNWASQFGVDELFFFTRRNPKVFIRHLKNGWQLDSYVMKRKNKTQILKAVKDSVRGDSCQI